MARGDQIYVIRPFYNIEGLYEHHGIDCGDGTVIHYRKPSEIIERTSLATFTQGRKIYVKQYPTSYISDAVVKRAESRLGEKKYNLLFNNCEHFATWCKTGVTYSQQVKDFIPAINNIDVDTLSEPLAESLEGAKQDDAQKLLNKALADIRVVWDNIQPQYKQAVQETDTWQKVAAQALNRNREDLARAALQRKINYKKRAAGLKVELDKLAKMTETLIRNSRNLPT